MKSPYVIILAATPREASKYAKRAELPRGRWRHATSASSISGLRRAELHVLPSYAKRSDVHAIEAVLRYGKHERIEVEMPEPAAVDQGDGMGEQLDLLADLEPTSYDGMGAPVYDEVVHSVPQARQPESAALEALAQPTPEAREDALEEVDDDRVAQMRRLSDAVQAEESFHAADMAKHEAKIDPVIQAAADSFTVADLLAEQDDALGEPVDDIDLTLGDPVAPINKRKRRSKCKVCEQMTLGDDDPAHDAGVHAAALKPVPAPSAADLFN